jgi:hypothetical protein
MNVIKNGISNSELVKMLRTLGLTEFNTTYLSLATLLARVRRSTHAEVVYATPPGQTTIPEDPNHSGGSISSSSSTESKPEPYAQNVATNLLTTTYSTVIEWIEEIDWANPQAKLRLSSQYVDIVFF